MWSPVIMNLSETDQNGPMSQFEGNRICHGLICHENCGSVHNNTSTRDMSIELKLLCDPGPIEKAVHGSGGFSIGDLSPFMGPAAFRLTIYRRLWVRRLFDW